MSNALPAMVDTVSTTEVARSLHRSPETVRQWCASGRIAATKIGGRWHIPTAAVHDLLAPLSVNGGA